MKRCPKCGETKERSEFSRAKERSDGLRGWCKACCQAAQRTPKGKETQRKAVSKHFKTAKGKANRKRSNAQHRRDWPEKVKAHGAISSAVRGNRIPPPSALMCACGCGRAAEEYHHFNGYEPKHWFEIDAYTRECHGDLHRV